MKANSSSKSGLFLIELIIVIAFFAVTSAICMQLFVKAHTLSAASRDLNRSVAAATSAVSCFKASDGDAAQAALFLGGELAGEDTVLAYYDGDWQPVAESDPNGFTLTMTSVYDWDGLTHAQVQVRKEGSAEVLYELDSAWYAAGMFDAAWAGARAEQREEEG